MARPLLYVAYPMRLDLGAANAIQTHSTVRALLPLLPGMHLVVPRWLREPSAFEDLGAIHLPRPAINKLSRLVPWAGWSYLERTLYSAMLVIWLVALRISKKGYRTLYVRDAICAAWLCLLAPIHGSRVIYEVHDLEALHPSKAARWPRAFWSRFLPWLDKQALSRACKLVSLTGAFREWAVARGLRHPSDIAVIPDAFDPHLYRDVDPAGARRLLGLPPAPCIIGYAGLTFAYRRLDLLVEAFATVAGMHDNVLLVLVGGRPQEVQELCKQAERLGVADRVVTPGQVGQEKAALYLHASDILVIPDTVTQLTASPLKLFDYLAAGKAIVLKDMLALREILDDHSALFFPEGDASALASALNHLVSNPELRDQLGTAALARSTDYTYDARARKILEVVKSCP
ncbi:MAG: glycosyltransferase family 4 protein [Chloroflexia bacterium]